MAQHSDDDARPRSRAEPLGAIIERRTLLAAGLGAMAALAGCSAPQRSARPTPSKRRSRAAKGRAGAPFPFVFDEVAAGADDKLHVPSGYRATVILADGDPILPGGRAWQPEQRTAEQACLQFGSNADFTAFFPLPPAADGAARGLLCVNHEHPTTRFLFTDLDAAANLPWQARQDAIAAKMNPARVALEQAVVGHSVVELERRDGRWRAVPDGAHNRRITALRTHIALSGPAAGHPRLQTDADRSGRDVIGTFHNCSGGTTPWGTVLFCEENFDSHFFGDIAGLPDEGSLRRNHLDGYKGWPWWGQHDPRFDVRQTPNECNRFGWVVELDPFDPKAPLRKRTALGRFSHEAAANAVAPDGRLVVYMGDDKPGEYLYRFVSRDRVSGDRAANRDLLDHGELSVAVFFDDGTVRWRPLRHGAPGLTAADGFPDAASVLIDARKAADAVGATPMDRPEDVEPQPGTGVVHVALTNHAKREKTDAVHPRAHNRFGHILTLIPPGGPGPAADHAADVHRWEIAMLCGDPRDPAHDAEAHPETSASGWLASPDNFAFDPGGRLWVATDQGSHWTDTGRCDGLFAVATEGQGAYRSRLFLRAPLGAEVAGPSFTPDGRTLFVSIQHPGVDVRGSSYHRPATRFPDFDPKLPPRAAVVAIEREDGGPIGGR